VKIENPKAVLNKWHQNSDAPPKTIRLMIPIDTNCSHEKEEAKQSLYAVPKDSNSGAVAGA